MLDTSLVQSCQRGKERVCFHCAASFEATAGSRVKYCPECKAVARAKKYANLTVDNLAQNQPPQRRAAILAKSLDCSRKALAERAIDPEYLAQKKVRKKVRKAKAKAKREQKRQIAIAETKERKRDPKLQNKKFKKELKGDRMSFKSRVGLGVVLWVERTSNGHHKQRLAAIRTNRTKYANLRHDELPQMPPITIYRNSPDLLKEAPYRSYAERAFGMNFKVSVLPELFTNVFIESAEGFSERWLPGITPFGLITAKVPDFRILAEGTDITLEISGFIAAVGLLRRSLYRKREPHYRFKDFKSARKELLDCLINFWLRTQIFVHYSADCAHRQFAFMTPKMARSPEIIAELSDAANSADDAQAKQIAVQEVFRRHTYEYHRELKEIVRKFLPNDYFKLESFFAAVNESFASREKYENIYAATKAVSDLYDAVNFPTGQELAEEQYFVEHFKQRELLSDERYFENYIYDDSYGVDTDRVLSKFIDRKYYSIKLRYRKAREYELAKVREYRRLYGRGFPSTHELRLMRSLGLKTPEDPWTLGPVLREAFAPLC